MALIKYKLGDLIEQRREKYDGKEDLPIRGVTRDGFIFPKVEDADTSLYNVFYRGDFVFNPARMELNSIALNTEFEKAICSSLYEVFFVKRQDIILPEYLNLFIKRDEFARNCKFIGWGSAREYCRVANISEIWISVPDIPIQRKYAAIYSAMVENQRAYEKGLDDLKLTCDTYVEELRRKMRCEKIGRYLLPSDRRNDLELDLDKVRGLAVSKQMITTKADMDGVSLSSYKVFPPNYIAYVPDTSRRGDKVSMGYNDTDDTFLLSSISSVFTTNERHLLAKYLMVFFCRSEFDRYARFHSWGSARETFDWKEMCNVEIPIPNIEEQRAVAELFSAYTLQKEINEILKSQVRDICPILVKGALEEAGA